MNLTLNSVAETFDAMFRSVERASDCAHGAPTEFGSVDECGSKAYDRACDLLDDQQVFFDHVQDPLQNTEAFYALMHRIYREGGMAAEIGQHRVDEPRRLALINELIEMMQPPARDYCNGVEG